MKLQTLSHYRLTQKSTPINALFTAFNGVKFAVLKSIHSTRIAHFYFVDPNWKENNSHRVVPLAYVQISQKTGAIAFKILQPQKLRASPHFEQLKHQLKQFILERK